MDDIKDLNVLLLDFKTGSPLLTFDTAKTISKNSSRQRRCAVEAKADQRFAIKIMVKAGFDWADCNGLEVRLGFDVGEEVNCRSLYLLKDRKKVRSLDLPYLEYSRGMHSYCIHDLLLEGCGPHVRNAHFYFRRLRDDHLVGCEKGLPRTLDSQGKIRVEIARTTINVRDQDRGLQADITPTYRRQTKAKLLHKGITLEVLLRINPAEGNITYRGNFRSDRPKDRSQQANFDFIYREVGHHDACVAPGNIVEVSTSGQSVSSAKEDFSDETPLDRDSLGLVTVPSMPVAMPPTQLDVCPLERRTLGDMQPKHISFLPLRGPQNQSTSHKHNSLRNGFEPPLDESEQDNDLPAVSMASQIRSSASSEMTFPMHDSSRSSISANTTPPTDYHVFTPETQQISDLLKAQSRRKKLEAQEVQSLQVKVTQIEQKQDSCRTRCESLRVELEKVTAEAVALSNSRNDLEKQQQQITRASEELDERARRALDSFRNTLEEIEQLGIQSANSRKRKRDERVYEYCLVSDV